MFTEFIYKMQHALNCFTFKKHENRLLNAPLPVLNIDLENAGNEIYDKIDVTNHLSNRQKNTIGFCNAAINELVELKVALGEKWWSTKAENLFNVKEDARLKHVNEEYIDVLHFVMSIGHCLGMTPEEMIDVYKKKNAVNYKRQENGY